MTSIATSVLSRSGLSGHREPGRNRCFIHSGVERTDILCYVSWNWMPTPLILLRVEARSFLMGLFRTVHMVRPCERCGLDRPLSVQFKTGFDNLQEYRLGQIVNPDENLQPGKRYPAAGWRYCGPCAELWCAAASRAWLESVCEFARMGRLRVRDKMSGAELSPEEIARQAGTLGQAYRVNPTRLPGSQVQALKAP